MWERFRLRRIAEVLRSYNVAPTSTVATIRLAEGERVLDGMRWGLIPPWSRDIKDGLRALNARAETLAQLRTFKDPFRHRRCFVVADGYYEWMKTTSGEKRPYHIHLPRYQPFAFAGLWQEWRPPGGDPLLTCTIITTEPNEQLAAIHNRMPVILTPEAEGRWLDPEAELADLQALLRPYPVGELVATPVSPRVGNVRYKEPDCIAPLV
jgi:putative SOS response-associated peptidase YedK